MKPGQADVSLPLQPPGRGAASADGRDGQPRDYVLWSLLNVLVAHAVAFLGCCLFPALVFSIKARDCKVLGDLEGAQRYGARAKKWNIVCSILLAIVVVLIIASFITIHLLYNF